MTLETARRNEFETALWFVGQSEWPHDPHGPFIHSFIHLQPPFDAAAPHIYLFIYLAYSYICGRILMQPLRFIFIHLFIYSFVMQMRMRPQRHLPTLPNGQSVPVANSICSTTLSNYNNLKGLKVKLTVSSGLSSAVSARWKPCWSWEGSMYT